MAKKGRTSSTRRPRAARPRASRPAVSRPPRTAAAPPDACTIVGVGASAGGLQAFTELLKALPPDPGFAIVLVQHLSPDHQSEMAAVLQPNTPIPVAQVSDGMALEANQVYVIPPNVQMGISDTRLFLTPRPTGRSQYTPIDFFFASLASAAQDRAVGVILSGTASDGAVGIREIKAAGGLTIAQRPSTARYDGMPRAAIATGQVDLVLAPEEIARTLVDLAAHPPLAGPAARLRDGEVPVSQDQLDTICSLLLSASGIDFKQYKSPTIRRRLQRRVALQRLRTTDDYIALLRENPGEVTNLYHDILIHVTRFFRDRSSYTALATDVFPEIFEERQRDQPVRAWVSGCATGEEAYSLAIEMVEYLADRGLTARIQLFATDVSDAAIEQARNGVYPAEIAADVPPERLRRYFTKVDGGYRVSKALRDLCVFARQDLTRDPPFSRLDLIFCRNVLIYMSALLQQRLMSIFHYALRPSGFLVLGQAETIGTHADLFATVDKKHRIFRKKPVESISGPGFRASYPISWLEAARPAGLDASSDTRAIQQEASRLILDRYAPPAVIVDSALQVIQFRGHTGHFLEPAPGEASLNLLKMAREGLLYGLRTALHAARKSRRSVRKPGLRVKSDGLWRTVDLEVVPATMQGGQYYLVVFDEPRSAQKGRGGRTARARTREHAPQDSSRTTRLEQELAATREYLQSIIQEVEAANEELQSANEEILSSNEELQSTNEELDTAKEELQSTNEELNTVNEELHGRNEELSRVNSDLLNLLSSVQIAIVIVSGELRIRRFTPMAERMLNLIATDVGRPIVQINPNIDCPDLGLLIRRVVEDVTPLERDVQDRDGRWYSLRIRPYKDVDNRIDGAVLTIFDIDFAKRHDEEVREWRAFADAVIALTDQPLLVIDRERSIRTATAAFCRIFGCTREQVERQPLARAQDGAWDFAELSRLVDDTLHGVSRPQPVRVMRALPAIGGRPVQLSARGVETPRGVEAVVLIGLEEEVPAGRGTEGH